METDSALIDHISQTLKYHKYNKPELWKKLKSIINNYFMQKELQRKSNILMFNLEETWEINNDLKHAVSGVLYNILPRKFFPDCVVYAFRIGKFQKDGPRRPILIKFISPFWKHLIFKCKEQWNIFDVTFSYDLNPVARRVRCTIVEAVKLFRNEKARIQRNHIVIPLNEFSTKNVEEIKASVSERLYDHFSENFVEDVQLKRKAFDFGVDDNANIVIKFQF